MVTDSSVLVVAKRRYLVLLGCMIIAGKLSTRTGFCRWRLRRMLSEHETGGNFGYARLGAGAFA